MQAVAWFPPASSGERQWGQALNWSSTPKWPQWNFTGLYKADLVATSLHISYPVIKAYWGANSLPYLASVRQNGMVQWGAVHALLLPSPYVSVAPWGADPLTLPTVTKWCKSAFCSFFFPTWEAVEPSSELIIQHHSETTMWCESVPHLCQTDDDEVMSVLNFYPTYLP